MIFLRGLVNYSISIMSIVIYPIYYFYMIFFGKVISLLRSELVRIHLVLHGHKVGRNFRIGEKSIINFGKNAKLIIGDNVIIKDNVFINVRDGATLIIGNNVHINKGCRISAFKYIEISDNVLIASYCTILDHDHVFSLRDKVSASEFKTAPIYIEEGVWIGAKVHVCKGIRIGKFSVVGANAVVTKNLKDSCIYVGIPAERKKCLGK